MTTITPITIATNTRTLPWRRWLLGGLTALAASVGMAASPASAAGAASNRPDAAQATSGAGEALPNPGSADGCVLCNGIRLQDEIVVVNTRGLCGSCDPESLRNRLVVENYAICREPGFRRWQRSDLESFLAFDPAAPTIIFVHGNQITPGDAKCEGLSVYRKLILQGCDAPKIRFVIFSWPSSKIGGLLNDVRVKAARTGPAGCQLAWLLDQLPAETPVSLVGFSFGARIITGGLHILAGGSLGGSLVLAERAHPDRAPVNAVLMAAALHSYWLAEGQYHGLAMTQVNRMLLLNNCADPAMRYYDLLVPGHGGPQALGLCGPTRISPQSKDKIFNRDVSRYVGSQHDLMRYVCGAGNAGLIWYYTAGATERESQTGG